MSSVDAIEETFDNIANFLDKAKAELRINLGQSQSGNSTIGLSFVPEMVLNYVPSTEVVKKGMYDSCCGRVHVEVLLQNPETGLIHLEVYDEPDPTKRFTFISTDMFVRLFKRSKLIEYVTGRPPTPPK